MVVSYLSYVSVIFKGPITTYTEVRASRRALFIAM